MANKCGSTETSTGKPCGKAAGAGTDHKGEGYCSLHKVSMLEKHEIDLEQVGKLAAVGLSIERVADYYGIHRDTFYEIQKRHPELLRHYKRGKAQATANVGRNLYEEATKPNADFQWVRFWLQTQGGYVPAERREHTGKDGGPIEVDEIIEVMRKAGE